MGFAINYRSTRPVDSEQAVAIRMAAEEACKGRTWLSCEPVDFYGDKEAGHLSGSSKPNFIPNLEDVSDAAPSGLPDGTARDLINVLCQLSRDFGIDWTLSHDFDPHIGFIRDGVCEDNVRSQIEAFADLPGILADLGEGDFKISDPADDSGDPPLRIWQPED